MTAGKETFIYLWIPSHIAIYSTWTQLWTQPATNVLLQSMLAIMFRPFGCIAAKTLNYLAFQFFDFEHTWWRLFWAYLMKVILSIPDEGYFEHTWWRLFWAYLMKVILSIPDEGYSRNVLSTLNLISAFLLLWWNIFSSLDVNSLGIKLDSVYNKHVV